MFLSLSERPSFTPIQNNRQIQYSTLNVQTQGSTKTVVTFQQNEFQKTVTLLVFSVCEVHGSNPVPAKILTVLKIWTFLTISNIVKFLSGYEGIERKQCQPSSWWKMEAAYSSEM